MSTSDRPSSHRATQAGRLASEPSLLRTCSASLKAMACISKGSIMDADSVNVPSMPAVSTGLPSAPMSHDVLHRNIFSANDAVHRAVATASGISILASGLSFMTTRWLRRHDHSCVSSALSPVGHSVMAVGIRISKEVGEEWWVWQRGL